MFWRDWWSHFLSRCRGCPLFDQWTGRVFRKEPSDLCRFGRIHGFDSTLWRQNTWRWSWHSSGSQHWFNLLAFHATTNWESSSTSIFCMASLSNTRASNTATRTWRSVSINILGIFHAKYANPEKLMLMVKSALVWTCLKHSWIIPYYTYTSDASRRSHNDYGGVLPLQEKMLSYNTYNVLQVFLEHFWKFLVIKRLCKQQHFSSWFLVEVCRKSTFDVLDSGNISVETAWKKFCHTNPWISSLKHDWCWTTMLKCEFQVWSFQFILHIRCEIGHQVMVHFPSNVVYGRESSARISDMRSKDL